MTNTSLGQQIEAAIRQFETERDRLAAKLEIMIEERASIKAQIDAAQTDLLQTEQRRLEVIAEVLSASGINLKGSDTSTIQKAQVVNGHKGVNGHKRSGEKFKYAEKLAMVLNAHKGQELSAGVLAEEIGWESRRVASLLKSIKGWESRGQRFGKRYFVREEETAQIVG